MYNKKTKIHLVVINLLKIMNFSIK